MAASYVSDDVRTVHCDVMAFGVAEKEGRMDSSPLDRRHVETHALPFGVRPFEVFDHEIEGHIFVCWRRTGQKHEVSAPLSSRTTISSFLLISRIPTVRQKSADRLRSLAIRRAWPIQTGGRVPITTSLALYR